MSKINDLHLIQGNHEQSFESKFDMIQQRVRESSSKKNLVQCDSRDLPTPFSIVQRTASLRNVDISGNTRLQNNQKLQQTVLQERQAIVDGPEFTLEPYMNDETFQQDCNVFVANILRLAASDSCGYVIDQLQTVKQIINKKHYSSEQFFGSCCSKHKFIKQNNIFQHTSYIWPILAIVTQRATATFLQNFIESIKSVFGVEVLNVMMVAKSQRYDDTALSVTVANGNFRSFLLLLRVARDLDLCQELFDCVPDFQPLTGFVEQFVTDANDGAPKLEAMAVYYGQRADKRGTDESYENIAKILHSEFLNMRQKENKQKDKFPKDNNRFALLVDDEQSASSASDKE